MEIISPRQLIGTALDVQDIPASPPPTGRRWPKWLTAGGLALVGGGLLFLIIVGAVAIFFAARGWFAGAKDSETFRPPDFIVAQFEGSKVVELCRSETSAQLCVYDAHTGQRLLMTDNLEFELISAYSWSPDGEQIVFSAGSDPLTGRHDHKVYIINADGSDLRQITSGDTNDIMPVWSPDGEWIAFHRTNTLWVVHPDGSEAQMLFEERGSGIGAMAWSPDSQRIAFWLKTERELFSLDEIWTINHDGTAPQVVHPLERSLVDANLTWDPEGQHIVCHCVFDDGEKKNLLFNADGLGGEPLAIEVIPWSWFPVFWPQWGKVY